MMPPVDPSPNIAHSPTSDGGFRRARVRASEATERLRRRASTRTVLTLALLACPTLFAACWGGQGAGDSQGYDRTERRQPTATTGEPIEAAKSADVSGTSRLLIPVDGIQPDQLEDTYTQARSGGRVHNALDIMAPRNTPVLAATDGVIRRLFESKPGGTTIYQFGTRGIYCYYYAHLERYAPGLKEGDQVRRGDVIGYVGTTGNAPPGAPHLHFAIYELGPEKRWWEGEPVNPYPMLGAQTR